MKRWSLPAGVAALAAAVLAVGPMGASANTKAATVTASIRVSSNCTVTISGHWSNLSFPATQLYTSVSDGGTPTVETNSDSYGVRNGNFKDVYSATPSTTESTITGDVSVYDMTDGWISAATVSTDAYCSGPFRATG